MAVLKTTSPVVLPFAPTETPRNTVPSSRASTAGVDTPVPRFAPRAFRRCAKREVLLQERPPASCFIRASLPGANINYTFDHCLCLLQPNYIVHRIQAWRASGQPFCRPQRSPSECGAVGGAMRDFHPLPCNREGHGMVADDVAGSQHRKADITRPTRRQAAVPLEHRDVF